MSNVRIRKVSILRGRAKKEADKMDLEKNDLVIVKAKNFDPLPDYELEKIEGDPISYLFDRPRIEDSEHE